MLKLVPQPRPSRRSSTALIIVAMILVFVIQFNPSAGKKTATLGEQCAARVRGWCINPKDHLAAFRIMIPRGQQGELLTKKAKQMGLMKVALDGLIERELLVTEGRSRIGLSVNEDEVTDEIFNGSIHVSVPSDNPGLAAQLNVMDGKVYAGFRDQKTKRFELKVYERSIKALVGRSPTEFREEQARELLAAKVRDLVRTPVRVSDVEATESYIDEQEHGQRDLRAGPTDLGSEVRGADGRGGHRRVGEGPG